MKIKTHLRITAAVFLITSVIILAVFFWAYTWMEEAFRKQRVYYNITDKVFALDVLSDGYLIHPGERLVEQWQWVHQSLTELLAQVEPKNETERTYHKGLAKNREEIKSIFERLALEMGTDGSAEIRARLSNQLMTELRLMSGRSSSLFFSGQATLRSVQKKTALLLIGLTCGMVLINGIFAFHTGRYIVSSLAQLQRGIRSVEKGELGSRVDVRGNSEIAEVALAFNEMTVRLKTAYESLEAEIDERRRTEESLRVTSKALSEREKLLRDLSERLLKTQEEERKRFAGELHDTIGGLLNAMKFKVEGALIKVGAGPSDVTESLATILPMIQEGAEECRRIQMDLRPSILDDLGLLPTLSWFCRRFQTIYRGIDVRLEEGIEESEIPNSLKIVIYRITQEAMNNIAKHGKANQVRLHLQKRDGRVELALEDNGQGFNLKRVLGSESPRRGLGLTSMKERAELSGGSFFINSIEGKGTIIRASWPFPDNR